MLPRRDISPTWYRPAPQPSFNHHDEIHLRSSPVAWRVSSSFGRELLPGFIITSPSSQLDIEDNTTHIPCRWLCLKYHI